MVNNVPPFKKTSRSTNLNMLDLHGHTPLIVAGLLKHYDAVLTLMAASADLIIPDATVFFLRRQHSNAAIGKFLISSKPMAQSPSDKYI